MSAHATTAEAHGQNGHITVKTLLTIYAALIGLMFLTFGAAKVDLGAANFLVAMRDARGEVLLDGPVRLGGLLRDGLALDDSILSHDSVSLQWVCVDARR